MIQDNGWYRNESDTALRDKLADDFPIGTNDASFSFHQKILDDLSLSNTRVSLDIGAYTGAWTSVLSDNFNAVYSFELSADNCECITKNTESKTGITLHNVIISHRTSKTVTLSDGKEYVVEIFLKDGAQVKQGEVGIMELTDAADYSSSRFVRADRPTVEAVFSAETDRSSDITMKEIDEYSFTDVDLINLHTNGSEYLAIMGAIDTIAACRPVIIYQADETEMSYYSHQTDTCNFDENAKGEDKSGRETIQTPETIDEFVTSLGYSITTNTSFDKWGMTYRIAVPD
jgi:FkbM family methyltransferase